MYHYKINDAYMYLVPYPYCLKPELNLSRACSV